MDEQWVAGLKRMGAANRRATRRRLRSLTLEQGLREFEQLVREAESAFGERPAVERRTHPVGLVYYWRKAK